MSGFDFFIWQSPRFDLSCPSFETRVGRSEEDGVRQSGSPGYKGNVASEIVISRNAISRQLKEHGPQESVRGQVAYWFRIREEESPKTIDIGIHEIAKSEIPTK